MDAQLAIVSGIKTKEPKRHKPQIKLSGKWLEEIGFSPDKLVTANYENCSIVLQLEEEEVETENTMIKGLLRNSIVLLQVRQEIKGKMVTPHIEMKGFWLEDLGFRVGCEIIVSYKQNLINIQVSE